MNSAVEQQTGRTTIAAHFSFARSGTKLAELNFVGIEIRLSSTANPQNQNFIV
jgi:hypothetical protein